MKSIPQTLSLLDKPVQQGLESCAKGHLIFKAACDACKSMQKEWYSYLTRSGFEDAEKGVYLVQDSLNTLVDMQHQTTFRARREYYQWAQECLTTCSFDSMIDRMIWQHHAEGFTQGEIAPVVGLKVKPVNRAINRLEKILKVK